MKKKIKNISVDDLAVMVQNGFTSLDKKIDNVEKSLTVKIDDVEDRLTNRIQGLERRINTMVDVKADKVHMLEKRVMRIEAKIGIN